MLHIITVHWRSDRWIGPQLASIQRFAPGATTWAALDGVDESYFSQFDHAWRMDEISLDGGIEPYASTSKSPMHDRHGVKLNELASRASAVANDEDLLLFLDGDALLVAPPSAVADLPEPLSAVRRDENLGDQFPHPSFCITTFGFWKQIDGDWRRGEMLMNSAGERFTDTGTRLYRLLEDAGVEWRPLTRLNRRDLHPLWFGVYGDAAIGPVVYHHGAGFRERRARIDSVKMGTGGRLAVRLMSWRRARINRKVERWIRRDPEGFWRRRFQPRFTPELPS